MIFDIILAMTSAAALTCCVVYYRKYMDARYKSMHAESAMESLRRELESGKAAAESLRQSEADAARQRLEDLRRLNESQIEQLNAAHQAQTRQITQSCESQMQQLRCSHETQLTELRQAYESQIVELKNAHQAQLEHERDMLGEKFKALAADVLQANSTVLDRNSRISLEAVLSPMKTNLEEFIKSYRDTCDVDKKDRMSLLAEIQNLHKLNSEVSRETGRLATALKGNTGVQGRWGEMVLANILEHSGLQEGRWFVTQESTTVDGDRLRPDAVIHCPGNRDIIIDSKVSLTAYLQMLEADTEEKRTQLAKEHLASVENHIKTLRNKDYQSKIGAKKGDFVLMFMPHEGAYLAAMHTNPDLWMKAYDSHVVMVSPTHLVTVLHLVEQMWQSEDQTANAEKIAECGTKLANSIVAFLEDLDSVGKGLNNALSSYNSAVKRFSTGNNNVTTLANRLSKLGLKAKKQIPARFVNEYEEPDDITVPGELIDFEPADS